MGKAEKMKKNLERKKAAKEKQRNDFLKMIEEMRDDRLYSVTNIDGTECLNGVMLSGRFWKMYFGLIDSDKVNRI